MFVGNWNPLLTWKWSEFTSQRINGSNQDIPLFLANGKEGDLESRGRRTQNDTMNNPNNGQFYWDEQDTADYYLEGEIP